ncbi:AraC family transcriptional regulator [Cytobacillus horneckiae]|uniref:AraC family transcriptional regulator n=1 Tax=Cytobacillus horneckiae TaxID=549687 RepID=UPI003D195816
MNDFIYKKYGGITALSASITDFSYKKHSHSEYAIGVTRRGIQHYHLDGHLQLSYQNGVMLFNPEQTHDGMAHDDSGLEYVMLYIEPHLLLEAVERREIFRFSNPIIYNKNIQYHIINLAKAVFKQENEHICDDLFIKLADSLIGYDTCDKLHGQDSVIFIIKDKIRSFSKANLRIDMIAEEFSMSKFQFIRFFKSQTGMTPYQFYLNCKIEGAKEIIEKERDVYSAISEYQFVDLTHLNRQFKKIYGLTATDYSRYMN